MRLVSALVLASVVSVAPTAAQPRLTMEWQAMAERLVAQLDPQPGERILLLSRPGNFDEILPHLRYALMEVGAVDLGVVDVIEEPFPETWDADVIRRGYADARAAYKEMFRDVDGAIMMPGARPGQPAYGALQDWLNEDVGRTIHFHWTQNGSAFPIPGQPLPGQAAIDANYQRALLDTNYATLASKQREFVEEMRNADVRVTSPIGTDISFRIGDRPVNFQDGNASKARTDQGVILIDREIELPAGSIRVAPLEETVNGVIGFPHSQWDGRPVEGLRITFERGRIVGVTADKGLEAAQAELDGAPAEARAFREFALGFNPLLAVPERNPWIPYYGYGAGVVRLSLGDNSELGGTVGGRYFRWNFFTDTTVTLNGEVWVRAGRLVR